MKPTALAWLLLALAPACSSPKSSAQDPAKDPRANRSEPISDEFDIPRLRHAHKRSVPSGPGRFSLPCAFPSGFPKGESMEVYRMMVHAEVDNPNSHPLTVSNNQRR